jgi:hypothetical protein
MMSSEYVFELKPAVKQAVPPLIALWGKSGSGKTYSAILLARGLVGPKGKVAVIDTENNRAKFYSDIGGGWLHLDLQPPFSPAKYSAAFKFCETQGANVIVVDSMSHVWSGDGGVLDTADEIGGVGLHKWKAPKFEYKKMMNSLLRSSIPVIFCVRAKDGVKQVGRGKDAEIVSVGVVPIAEKGFIFEMTVDLHMTRDGAYDLEKSKAIPSALRGIIRPDGIVNEAMGAGIAEWAGSGQSVDPEFIRLKQSGRDAAIQGLATYTAWGKALTETQKKQLGPFLKGWLDEAKAADASKEQSEEDAI